ncbi:MAG: glycosyl transferase, partial [Alphaproteobacteria bacterium]
ERVWRPHREHFYQIAVRRGLDHAGVCGRVLGTNLMLVLLAAASVLWSPWPALAAAALVVAVTLAALARTS